MTYSRKLWKKAARLALILVVVGVLFHFVDWRHVLSALTGASLAWLLPAYALVVARRALAVAQMARLLRLVGCPVGWWRVFRANRLRPSMPYLRPRPRSPHARPKGPLLRLA